ncbi:hypothetical protein BG011_008333 [Mortierella polycephala]|uniref:Pre-rRNA processing protein n=1 Tax=Mortierella polycephala TaxID=41804 RepID=A0A9P6PPV3_9FUNG|nr:hypothetical protein BG011_008333 [Mortierella polycephala]
MPSSNAEYKDMPYTKDETEYRDTTSDSHSTHRHDNKYNHRDDSSQAEELESLHEYTTHEKPHRKTPVYKRRRYILGCIICTIIFLAIFIPLFLKFALKPIAQAMMDNATMTVVQLNMTDPQEDLMTVSVQATVGGIPKIFSASMEFTQAVEISWDGLWIGSMTLGTVHVSKGQGEILETTEFTIVNSTAFGQFAKVMLSAEGFTWTLSSVATVKTLGQTVKNLVINKKLDMHGLNNFSNIKILAFSLPSDAPDGNGALVSIQASIPNPSPIGMILGTITLDMFYETAYLGRVTAKDVILVGGQPMALNLEGQLVKQTDPIHAQELSVLISNYLANIPTLAIGKGVSVFPDGIHPVSWLTNAITSTSLSVPLLPVEPLDVIKDIAINDMNLIFSQTNPWIPTANAHSISATFKIPFDISINITELANTTFKMAYKGTPFAELTSAIWNTTASDMANNKVVFTIPSTPMNIFNQKAFTDFMTSVTQSDSSSVEVTGSAQGVAITSLGVVRLTVPLKTTLPLQGINFSNQKPIVSDILVVGGSTTNVAITGNITLMNPSIFSVGMGPIALQIRCTVNGTEGYVGIASIPNLVLYPGKNIVAATISFQPTDKQFGEQFLGAFVAGENFSSTIYGDENSSPIASMIETVKTLTLSATIPGLSPPSQLIREAASAPTLGQVLGPRLIPLTVTVVNPLATTFWIQTITASVFWEGNFFGGVGLTKAPFEAPPNTPAVSPQLAVQCPMGYDFALFLVTQFIPKNLAVLTGGIVLVDMTSKLDITLGGAVGVGYSASLNYQQEKLPAFLKIDYSFAGMTKRSLQGDIGHDNGVEIPSATAETYTDLTPQMRRRRMMSMDDQELYDRAVALVGEEAPVKESGIAYVVWMEKVLRALYPEHQ